MTSPSTPGRSLRDPSLEDAAEVARALEVDPEAGLSSEEAARRLARDGPNSLRSKPPVPLWRRVLAQFQDPLIYLLLAAVVVALGAWVAEGAHGLPVDAIVVAAIVVLNAIIGLIEERKAEDAVAALQSMTAASSTVLRDGTLRSIPSAELVRGDVLELSEGDSVGADGRLLSASALRISEASLTGESEAVYKDPAPLAAPAALGDRLGMVFKGTAVVQGVGRAVVTGTGMQTEVGAIAEMLEATEAEPTPLQEEIARVSKFLGITVIAIAVVVMGTIVLVNRVSTPQDLVTVLLLGVSLAVAAVPEGLPAILSVVLAIGVQAMARRNAVVKELHSVETLGSATVIASDKTGTLTRNEMTVERVVTASGEVELTGVGYRPEGRALSGGRALHDEALLTEARLVLGGGSLSGNAQLSEEAGEWLIQGDPTDAAFLVAARKLEGTREWAARFVRRAQIPFTSERKLMSTLQVPREGGEAVLFTKGAPDVLLRSCSRLRVGDEVVPLDEARRARLLADVEALSAQAFRTLGVAYRAAGADPGEGPGAGDLGEDAEHDLVFVGLVGMIDPPRPEARQAVTEAHRAGIRVMMVTGDHPATAARIAADLGIVEEGARAVTGLELDGLEPEARRAAVREASVFARVAPRNKLQLVDGLQEQGEIVAMTGDGVNDAPALKSADIGVAMGITGTEVTKEAAKMILGDDNFATIVAAVHQGRVIFDNIRKFLRYLLSSNLGEVCTVFFGVLFSGFLGLGRAAEGPVALPLLATQILWINLVTDAGPALAMGVDPEIDDVMARAPRRSTERIIDLKMWSGILFVGLVMAAATLLTMDLFLPGGWLGGTDSLRVARTAGFTTLVFAQLFNAFNSRSETTTAFYRPFGNRWLWAAVGLGVVLQLAVVELPVLQEAFGTASMDLQHWLVSAGLASSVLWLDELRKAALRAWGARREAPASAEVPGDAPPEVPGAAPVATPTAAPPKPPVRPARVLEAWSSSPSTRALRVSRPEGFAFEPGHAVRLFLDGPEGETSRSMSIASGPSRPYLEFAVRDSPSDFKRAFFALQPGGAVGVRGPKGRFLLDRSRPAVMLAGGVGITPFRGMLQALADERSEQPGVLVYACHDPGDVPFLGELEALVGRLPAFELLPTVSVGGAGPWPHRVGRVDPPLVADLATRWPGAAWYLAGPPEFVRALVRWALDAGVPQEAIHAEVFKGYRGEDLQAASPGAAASPGEPDG